MNCRMRSIRKQQTIVMVDIETGEFTEKALAHEGNRVREFYAALEGPMVAGIEAIARTTASLLPAMTFA